MLANDKFGSAELDDNGSPTSSGVRIHIYVFSVQLFDVLLDLCEFGLILLLATNFTNGIQFGQMRRCLIISVDRLPLRL